MKYGILCWGRASKTALCPITVLFNRAIRCIHFCNYRDSVTHLLAENKLLRIEDIFKLELGKFMFNFNKDSLPNNFNSYFKKTNTVHNYNTRLAKNNYFLPRKNKKRGQRSLSFLGCKLWSEIPDNLKNCPTILNFKYNYQKILLGKYGS